MKADSLNDILKNIIKRSAILIGPLDLKVSEYFNDSFKSTTWITKSKINKFDFEIKPVETITRTAYNWELHNKKVDVVFYNAASAYIDTYIQIGLWMPNIRTGGFFVAYGEDIEALKKAAEDYIEGIKFGNYLLNVDRDNNLIYLVNRR